MPSFRIAGLNITVESPFWMIEPKILEFASEGGSTDIRCQVLFKKNLQPDLSCTTILDARETTISKCGDYLHIFHNDEPVRTAVVTFSDWSRIKIYLDSAYEYRSDDEAKNRMRITLFDALSTVIVHDPRPKAVSAPTSIRRRE
jgi:hypothetical protein